MHGRETGKAKLTKGYRLSCQYVIRTPGPIWHDGKNCETELPASCHHSCPEIAVARGIRNIAFPSSSTGVYSYPLTDIETCGFTEAINLIKAMNQLRCNGFMAFLMCVRTVLTSPGSGLSAGRGEHPAQFDEAPV